MTVFPNSGKDNENLRSEVSKHLNKTQLVKLDVMLGEYHTSPNPSLFHQHFSDHLESKLQEVKLNNRSIFLHVRYSCHSGSTYEECYLIVDPNEVFISFAMSKAVSFKKEHLLPRTRCKDCNAWLSGDLPAYMVITMLNRLQAKMLTKTQRFTLKYVQP